MLQETTGFLIKAMTLQKHFLAWKAFWTRQTSDADFKLSTKIILAETGAPGLGRGVDPVQADT